MKINGTKYYTVSAAATASGWSRATINEAILNGHIRALRYGRRWAIPADELDLYCQSRLGSNARVPERFRGNHDGEMLDRDLRSLYAWLDALPDRSRGLILNTLFDKYTRPNKKPLT